ALLPFFNELNNRFSQCKPFLRESIDAAIKECAAAHGIKTGEIMQLLRVLVSGQGGGVDLIGMLELLGNEDVCLRLSNGLKAMPQ
ncbi:MAG: hypothetical protein ACKPAD_13875, partial [Bacteroidota bacterium]